MWLAILLAQTPDPLTGTTGWVGAGLLGLILAWLLFVHLPAKDKQLKEIIEIKDGQIRVIIEAKDALATAKDGQIREMVASRDVLVQTLQTAGVAAAKESRTDYKESLKAVVDHCQVEMASLVGEFRQEFSEMSEAVKDLRRVMEEFRESHSRPGANDSTG